MILDNSEEKLKNIIIYLKNFGIINEDEIIRTIFLIDIYHLLETGRTMTSLNISLDIVRNNDNNEFSATHFSKRELRIIESVCKGGLDINITLPPNSFILRNYTEHIEMLRNCRE
jgi:hypothetical protein